MSSASSSAQASNYETYGNTVSGNGSSGGASTWLIVGIAAAVLLGFWLLGRKE